MASIGNDNNGHRRILFYDPMGIRKTIRLGKVSKRDAESIKLRVEALLSSRITKNSIDRDTSHWLAGISDTASDLRTKLERAGLVKPLVPEPAKPQMLLADFLRGRLGGRWSRDVGHGVAV